MYCVAAYGCLGQALIQQVQQERCEHFNDLLAQGDIRRIDVPGSRPVIEVRAGLAQALHMLRVQAEYVFNVPPELAMLPARLLTACHHFPGFVYAAVRLVEATRTIEVDVRLRRGSKARCSCCGMAAPGYDVLPVRRFEFIPIWRYAVMLLYAMRRVQCARCGVKVEQVPWAIGKHSRTKDYMLYMAHWARKLGRLPEPKRAHRFF